MLTQNELDKIDCVIGNFVTARKEFTAFDVTKEVRKKYPSIRHYEVRNEVHSVMSEEDDYGRAQDFNLHSDGPWVYKPVANRKIQDAAKLPTNLKVANIVKNMPILLKRDNRGRVCVPAKFIRAAGLSFNSTVAVTCDTTREQVYISSVLDGSQTRDYVVDRDFNVRLSSAILRMAGIHNNSDVCCFVGQKNVIVIESY